MIVGCYTLHLYCDFCKPAERPGNPSEYTGRTEADCLRQAKADGWKIYSAQRKAKCPTCASSSSK